MTEDYGRIREDSGFQPRHPEMMKVYEEICLKEKNRDRYEIRRYRVCRYPALLTKTQEEWPFIPYSRGGRADQDPDRKG